MNNSWVQRTNCDYWNVVDSKDKEIEKLKEELTDLGKNKDKEIIELRK